VLGGSKEKTPTPNPFPYEEKGSKIPLTLGRARVGGIFVPMIRVKISQKTELQLK